MSNNLTEKTIHAKKAFAENKGPFTYWQVSMPKRSTLSLTGALSYVKKMHDNPQNVEDIFVYWPDYRVAGTIGNIVHEFTEAGLNNVGVGELYHLSDNEYGNEYGNIALSVDAVKNNSIDPLENTSLVNKIISQTGSKGDIEKLRSNTMLGKQLEKQIKTQKPTMTQSMATKKKTLVSSFNDRMDKLVAEEPINKIFDVNMFDMQRFTGVKNRTDTLKRSKGIQPVITINGTEIKTPIVADAKAFIPFQHFVYTIVKDSDYAPYVNEMINSFIQQTKSRKMCAGKKSKKTGPKDSKDLKKDSKDLEISESPEAPETPEAPEEPKRSATPPMTGAQMMAMNTSPVKNKRRTAAALSPPPKGKKTFLQSKGGAKSKKPLPQFSGKVNLPSKVPTTAES